LKVKVYYYALLIVMAPFILVACIKHRRGPFGGLRDMGPHDSKGSTPPVRAWNPPWSADRISGESKPELGTVGMKVYYYALLIVMSPFILGACIKHRLGPFGR